MSKKEMVFQFRLPDDLLRELTQLDREPKTPTMVDFMTQRERAIFYAGVISGTVPMLERNWQTPENCAKAVNALIESATPTEFARSILELIIDQYPVEKTHFDIHTDDPNSIDIVAFGRNISIAYKSKRHDKSDL